MQKTIKNDSRCISPFTKKGETMSFPCGKCVNCKKRRVSGWSFRLQQQAKIASSAWFVTFTYTTLTVPITPKGRMSLDRRDFQLFLKRLRKCQGLKKISYYTCGEYGTEKYRPHYHAIMFDVDLKNLVGEAMATKAMCNRESMLIGKTQMDCPLWGKGHVTIGQVSPASIGYVLEYISKKERIPQYKGDDREPEFSLMSKGIGANYFSHGQKIISYKVSVSQKVRRKGAFRNTILWRPKRKHILKKEVVQWHKADINNRFYAPLPDAKKASLPRYIRERIYTKMERELIGLYLERKENDRYMTLTREEQNQEDLTLSSYRELLATTADRESRSLKY